MKNFHKIVFFSCCFMATFIDTFSQIPIIKDTTIVIVDSGFNLNDNYDIKPDQNKDRKITTKAIENRYTVPSPGGNTPIYLHSGASAEPFSGSAGLLRSA